MNKNTQPTLIGFSLKSHVNIDVCLRKIANTQDSEVLLSMTLAANAAYRTFRERFVKKYRITSAEVVLDVVPNVKVSGVKISFDKVTADSEEQYQVIFFHKSNPNEEASKFTSIVTNKDLAQSLLPAHHLPERASFLKNLSSLSALTPLGDIFDVSVGINLKMASLRTEPSKYTKGRILTTGQISQTRFLREGFSDNIIDVPITRRLHELKKYDILLSTLPNNNPAQNYAMVVDSSLTKTYHNHVLLRLSLKPGVDPRMAKVFFALWANEKYRLLYPFIPGSLPMIHISYLLELPLPYLGDERMLKIVDSYVSKLISLDEQRLSTYQELKELF